MRFDGPARTDIYAVDDGEVVELLPAFNHGTGVIALRHTEGYILRYCEVMNESISGVELKQRFKAGNVIAKVGRMNTLTMLHCEMYSGTAEGKLGAKYPNIYQRRPDLIDPTPSSINFGILSEFVDLRLREF